MRVVCLLIGTLMLLCDARAECPQERPGLLRWSNDATWGVTGKPIAGNNIEISQAILVDVSPPSLSNITILPTGCLIFDPDVQLELRAENIFVEGTMEVGSEECPYKGYLTITLTGNREAHLHESNGKVVLVKSGGTLELHGEPRISWSKINKTLVIPKDSGDVYFEHKDMDQYTSFNGAGIIAYTVNVIAAEVTVKKFGLYDLRSDSDDLAEHINKLENGDVLMMAGQKKILAKTDGTQSEDAFEAIEKLINGEVTGTAVLRSVAQDGATWAFVYKKGTPGSYGEDTNVFGTTSSAQYVESNNLIFTVNSIGASFIFNQAVNFRVTNLNAIHQLVDVMDDVTTWHPGDRVMIASTDYDWKQAEEREIVFCPDCNNYQIRINEPVNFVHYGNVLHNAVDMRAEIALINRKVVIQGEMDPTCPEINLNCEKVDYKDTFGGHLKALYGFENVHIENIELVNMGQQTDLGRYPIHFHMCFGRELGQSQPYVKGCSIHDTFARCITVHGTHGVLIADNACINHKGHGYFLEDGGEMNNIFDGNLAMNTMKGTGFLEPVDLSRPAGFWFTNLNNYFRNNHAAGGEGNGIWVIFPDEPFPPSRKYNLSEYREATRTNLLEFTNNVAHSHAQIGVMIGNRLDDDRDKMCCNLWQPLVDPKDKSSDPIIAYLSYITGFKNKLFNIWIEGGSIDVSQISVADSTNGIIVTNEGQQEKLSGRLSNAVVIGDSENVDLPEDGFDRSLPFPGNSDEPHSGITMWKGPTHFSSIWFDGFTPNILYDNAAIAKKRGSPYFFSLMTSFKDLSFAFDDAAGVGTYAISGVKSDPGWDKNKDGELISGFTWIKNTNNVLEKWYVVKPDDFSAAASDCRLRPHWRMAVSKTKYGNLRVHHKDFDKNSRGIFARDDFPGAQLEFTLEKKTGPQVVLDGSTTYTFHITGAVPKWLKFTAEGIETGDALRFGVCIPSGATWDIESFFPERLKTITDFVKVDSFDDLDELDSVNDGKKYFYDASTRMLYYKFVGYNTRSDDETDECGGGRCPEVLVHLSGDLSGSGDCRQTLYDTRLTDKPPPLATFTDTILANGDQVPPEGYGAGATRPFSSRSPVNGGYGQWTEWSECSTTCDVGVEYKTRACNNPIPEHGGDPCSAEHIKSRTCQIRPCDIDGEFTEWSEWSECTRVSQSYCPGKSSRTRGCSNTKPKYGGIFCHGSTKEIMPCDAC